MASSLRQTPRRYSDLRLFAFGLAERFAQALGGRRFYSRRFLSPPLVRREVITRADLPETLEGLRIALLSDLHAGPFLDSASMTGVIDTTLAARPDLVVFCGDFIAHRVEAGVLLAEVMAPLAQVPLGALAVFGNHDYRGRREGEIEESFVRTGWSFLRNRGRRLGELPLVVTGIEDPEEGRVLDIEAAREALEPADLEVCLCHNPSTGPSLAREGCLAVLSGHSHGRQIDLPFLRGLGPAHPGLRVELGSTTLITSRGLGVVGLPLRVGAPAEVVLIELSAG